MKVLEGQLERRSTSRDVTKGCPFAEIIVWEPLPGNFKSAKVKDYDDNANPEEHLARFENMAMLHCYTDRIKCKVFLITLVDSAQRWFEGLAPQSISSFKDFQKAFSHHFSSKQKITREREVQECNRDLAPDHQLSLPEKRGFCTLHKVCYHNTEDCKTLKGDYVLPSTSGPSYNNKRPRLSPWTFRRPGSSARGGGMRSNPKSEPGRRREPEPERKKNSPPATMLIKMISGCSTDGDSNRARKSRSRRECMEVEGTRRNEAVISFSSEDLKGVNLPHNDALVIQARVANYDILRVFIDSGSSINVIFKDAFVQMDLQGFHLEAVETALFGFVGHVVYPEGEIVLPLTLGSQDLKKTVMTSFTVVDSPSLYNIILGRPAMNELRASGIHLPSKDKTSYWNPVGEVQGD
ncbi:uncharacterized protein LOC142554255 [Primulina tabacum]|uniref:uncharacterized protein LOC142554255 n=1 Tax=Primulina tabacum TaxID=48773 RepID=UPI003F5AC4B3